MIVLTWAYDVCMVEDMSNTATTSHHTHHRLGDFDVNGSTYTFLDVVNDDMEPFVVEADSRDAATAAAWAHMDWLDS